MNADRRASRLAAIVLGTMLCSVEHGELRIVGGLRGQSKPAEPATPADSTRPFLRWKNGEYLYGELVSATEDQVLWKAPIFGEPLALKMTHLKNLEIPRTGADSKEPLAIRLRNGDLVHG